MYKHVFKRVIDFTIALIALLVIWPILLIIYIWLTIAFLSGRMTYVISSVLAFRRKSISPIISMPLSSW